MNLLRLTNKDLNLKVIGLAQKEKELLAEAIVHIAEVERRKLYRDFGIASLFEYLTKQAGFSNGSAYRLMDAARLQLQVPELAEKIEAGKINMTQVRLVQEASRQRLKESKVVHGALQKAQVLESIQGLSVAESQKMVAQSFDLEIQKPLRVSRQKDGSVLVEMTFTAEQWAEVEMAKEAVSSLLPTGSYPEVLTHFARTENQKRLKEAKPRPNTFTLTLAKKKVVHQRDRCCQFLDPRSGEICGSKFNLQVDHIQPQWAGGSHDLENLQILCAAHNRLKYQKESGIRRCE